MLITDDPLRSGVAESFLGAKEGYLAASSVEMQAVMCKHADMRIQKGESANNIPTGSDGKFS